jgi:hypothetical protein
MENNKNHPTEGHERIDKLFRASLEGQRVEPGKDLWRGINRRLLIREMMRFNFSNLPGTYWIAGIAGIVAIPLIMYLVLSPAGKNTANSGPETRIEQPVPHTGTISSTHISGNPIQNPPTLSSNGPLPGKTAVNQPSNGGSSIVLNSSSASASQNVNGLNETRTKTATARVTGQKGLMSTSRTKNNRPAPDIAATATAVSGVRSAPKSEPEPPAPPAARSASNPSIHSMTSISSFGAAGKDTNKYPAPDMVKLGVFPAHYDDHAPVPQYFSAGLGFLPELTFYNSPSSYTKADIWLGADFAWHFWKFYIRPGVSIGYMYDQGASQVNYKRKDSIGFYYQVVSYSIDPHGVISYQTEKRTVFDSLVHIGYNQSDNRYQYVQVPLMVGFDVLEIKNFGLSVQAGPVVSFFIADRITPSQNVDLTNSRILYQEQSSSPGKDPNWQIWASIHVGYRIDDNFDFYVEPTYKYYFSPVTGYQDAKAPWSLGLGIGFRYNFGFNTMRP